jgi:hypothetical protein
MSTSFLGSVYARLGRRRDAQAIRARMTEAPASRYISHLNFAILDSPHGNNDMALGDLEQASQEHDHWRCFLRVDPRLAGLRSDRRFGSLLRQIKSN